METKCFVQIFKTFTTYYNYVWRMYFSFALKVLTNVCTFQKKCSCHQKNVREVLEKHSVEIQKILAPFKKIFMTLKNIHSFKKKLFFTFEEIHHVLKTVPSIKKNIRVYTKNVQGVFKKMFSVYLKRCASTFFKFFWNIYFRSIQEILNLCLKNVQRVFNFFNMY